MQLSNINLKKNMLVVRAYLRTMDTHFLLFCFYLYTELLACKEDKLANNGNKPFLQVML